MDEAGARLGPWSFLGRYRWRVLVGSLNMVASVGLFVTIPYYLGRTVDALQGPDPAGDVPRLALIMLALACLLAVMRTVGLNLLDTAARMAEHDLRTRVFSHLLRLDLAYFKTHRLGDIMSRLSSDVHALVAMWSYGVHVTLGVGLASAVSLVLMIDIDPMLSLWALAPFPALPLIGRLLGRRIQRLSLAAQRQLGELSSSAQEDLTGIGLIKSYHLEDQRIERFSDTSVRLVRRNMVAAVARGLLQPSLGVVAALSMAAVLWVGGVAVIEGRIALGQLIQFNAYIALMGFRVLAVGNILAMFQRGLASWARVEEVLVRQPAIADGHGAKLAPASVRGDIEIRDLTIEIGEQRLLDGVSVRLPAGTVTAVVGRIGGGKSTLVEAIPRLLDVPRGTLFIDDCDITDLRLSDLRRLIGYAPQEAYLFSATIAENIEFGTVRNGKSAPREAIVAAARVAGLDRDLTTLPDGLDTVVGERGITLSGGQRQRVALARAIASDPRILILDDSLSSVDAETEKQILDQLAQVQRGRTVVLISHRVAAVKRADQIIVLDGGRLVESGRHAELLARDGVYAEIYRTQLDQEAAG